MNGPLQQQKIMILSTNYLFLFADVEVHTLLYLCTHFYDTFFKSRFAYNEKNIVFFFVVVVSFCNLKFKSQIILRLFAY